MKIRAVILAGGEGTRLGILTAKRTKPAVPFAGKYRIIDFALSNCVNSNIFDVMIIAQYRPHSLIEHIGSGGPWDLNRESTGGVRIYTPYRARASGWFVGTADAVQQNFSFIKSGNPDHILVLSGDHVYGMDYQKMIDFHLANDADLTMAAITVPVEEAPRYGIIAFNEQHQITSFVEKPARPPSNLANMGVYLFKRKLLDEALWQDNQNKDSAHDFGKNILPNMIAQGKAVYGFPYQGYWVDVGTVNSYWQAHMDLLNDPPPIDLYNRDWVFRTRTEAQPPATIQKGAKIEDSMISQGCIIEKGARVTRSILSPGVHIKSGAWVHESILLNDCIIEKKAMIQRSVIDKRAVIQENSQIGECQPEGTGIAMVGKNAILPPKIVIRPGGMIGPDVIPSDFSHPYIEAGEYLQTKRPPNEV